MNNIESVLKKLKIDKEGQYDNHFYVIQLSDSDEYAKMYSQLCENSINTEYPSFGVNSSNNTTKITNYFEIEDKNIAYNIFLIADFNNDKYYIKIGER